MPHPEIAIAAAIAPISSPIAKIRLFVSVFRFRIGITMILTSICGATQVYAGTARIYRYEVEGRGLN